ncbi:Ku protein [Streptomyces sp. NBC_01361]|uniref:Ku protein n=1 Tax=Streptomyces sp. NBC_01361 TaxID=2903838 RepID=UPI002E347FEE|nr:Ku protein [Streptomyces sp. NBC_01361]
MSYARRTISCTSSGSSSTSSISLSRRFTAFAARSGKREEPAAPTVADSGQSIDPIRIGHGYFLEPDGQVANKPYTLLRTALERNSKAAVAKFAWHARERLGLLRIKDNAIILHAMRWPDEIRSPQSLAPAPVELTEDEIGKALALMDALATDDIPKDVAVDRYTEAISDLITANQTGKQPSHAAEEEAPAGAVVDLMAALQESVSVGTSAVRLAAAGPARCRRVWCPLSLRWSGPVAV